MEVKLKVATVKIKDELTWGDEQKIEVAKGSLTEEGGSEQSETSSETSKQSPEMLKSMMKIVVENKNEAKYVALECAILEIIENGTKVEFTRDWMDNLSVSDGEKLYEAVNKLSKKNEEKKSTSSKES